jgi:hypothetical protein
VRVAVDTRPPAIHIASLVPLRVRVSEPATVAGAVNGARVAVAVKAGVTRIHYVGAFVKTVRLVARDAAGNVSRVVTWRR